MSVTKDKVWKRIRKTPDADLCIKQTTVGGVEVVQVRDFLRTRNVFGRGVVFPARLLPELISGLSDLQRHLGVDLGPIDPGPDQGRLT